MSSSHELMVLIRDLESSDINNGAFILLPESLDFNKKMFYFWRYTERKLKNLAPSFSTICIGNASYIRSLNTSCKQPYLD
jgi:hypothetical protein